jgi:hypothetical protein
VLTVEQILVTHLVVAACIFLFRIFSLHVVFIFYFWLSVLALFCGMPVADQFSSDQAFDCKPLSRITLDFQ